MAILECCAELFGAHVVCLISYVEGEKIFGQRQETIRFHHAVEHKAKSCAADGMVLGFGTHHNGTARNDCSQ